ncbi:hypothetical protein TNCV_2850051 [Trichonephila clavipes]|nr:hypothetical protein TNCV_2850051 [Trichonephila clavipes]
MSPIKEMSPNADAAIGIVFKGARDLFFTIGSILWHLVMSFNMTKLVDGRSSSIVVSDADYCAVGIGFESRRKHVCLLMLEPLRHKGTLNSRRAWYWARIRDKASHDPIPLPLGYRGHCMMLKGMANDRRTSRSPTCLRLWQLSFLPFGKAKITT